GVYYFDCGNRCSQNPTKQPQCQPSHGEAELFWAPGCITGMPPSDAMTSSFRSFSRNPAVVVFTVALLAQVFVVSRLAASEHLVPEGGDMRFYLDWGRRIFSGQWTDHHAFYGLPGYAYWLAVLLALT